MAGDRTVADSTRTLLVWEEGKVLPVHVFPLDDVDRRFLEPAAEPPEKGHHGLADYHDLVIDGQRHPNAVWTYQVTALEGHVAFDWSAMDRWLEEDEEMLAHPRDPYHRVDARRSSRRVRVTLDGTVLADTTKPTLVFETGLPTRYYLPPEDVATELLEPSSLKTVCAYKGVASYWSVRIGGALHPDMAWSYLDPLPDQPQIAGLICFLNEKVDHEVDGRPLERPRTQWSSGFRDNLRGGGSGADQITH